MRVIARSTLRDFWRKHPQAEMPLQAWFKIAHAAQWQRPQDIKAVFGGCVDFVGDNRAIFDIGGNKFRLVVHFDYSWGIARVKFVGTHKDYDAIDARSVEP